MARLSRQEARWTRVRVGLATAALAVIAVSIFAGGPSWPLSAAALLLAGGFIAAVAVHRRIQRAIARYANWRAIKRTHRARLDRDWADLPHPRSGAMPEDHPFADLHLTGEGSLHHLLDVAVTDGGSTRLERWLLDPDPDPQATQRRQRVVRELAPRSRFRDKLLFAGQLDQATHAEHHGGLRLIQWLRTDDADAGLRRTVWMLGGLALANIGLFAAWLLGAAPAVWLGTLSIYAIAYYRQRRHIGTLFPEAASLERLLRRLKGVFRELEMTEYAGCPELAEHCAPFRDPANRPSAELARMSRVAEAASLQAHPLWLPLNLLVPWDLYFADRLRVLKSRLSGELRDWLTRWFELEALIGLANWADLQPEFAFPAIDPVSSEDERPLFEARGLGHPLIPDDQRVANDFAIDRLGSVTIVTGSNMAGKSTFLRTIGINLRLAYAGGPVAARSLTTVPFRLYTCIRPSDSIADGISHFYAEVKRLRTLLDELDREGPYPVFFLIDEIFSATNNRERLLGSQAYLTHLLEKNGVGVISTHDLELAQLEAESDRVRNRHFREHVENGAMRFDYKLREGPCPTTNALTIMAMEGLPITSERRASGSPRSGR